MERDCGLDCGLVLWTCGILVILQQIEISKSFILQSPSTLALKTFWLDKKLKEPKHDSTAVVCLLSGFSLMTDCVLCCSYTFFSIHYGPRGGLMVWKTDVSRLSYLQWLCACRFLFAIVPYRFTDLLCLAGQLIELVIVLVGTRETSAITS